MLAAVHEIAREGGEERMLEVDSVGRVRPERFEALVDELLIAHEAARLSVEITDADLDAAVAMIKTHNNLDDAAFDRAVAASDRTMAEYRAQNRRDMLRFKLFLTLFHGRITIRIW